MAFEINLAELTAADTVLDSNEIPYFSYPTRRMLPLTWRKGNRFLLIKNHLGTNFAFQ